MTIEYKDSKRIVALSDDTVETPTYSDDFSGTDDWADQGSGVGVNTTTDRLEFDSWTDNSTNNSSTLDLGSALSDTAWVIRFKLQWTGFSNTTDWTAPAIGMFSADSSTGGNSAQDMLFYWSIANGSEKRVYLSSADNSTISGTDHNLNLSWKLNTTYYVELVRDGSNFSATVWTGKFGGSIVASGTDTIGGTVSGLQYFGAKSPVTNRGGSFSGWLDNLKIWNGVTSVTDRPTNVQDNSLLVEKDTGDRYWFDEDNIIPTELTVGTPYTTHSAGWDGRIYFSELSDLPNVGDVITGGRVYVGTANGAVRLGLYSDNNGLPQNLLAETASVTLSSTGWLEIDFITPYTTTSTDKLHIGLQVSTGNESLGYVSTGITNARSYMTYTTYTTFPSTASGLTEDNAVGDFRAIVSRTTPKWINPYGDYVFTFNNDQTGSAAQTYVYVDTANSWWYGYSGTNATTSTGQYINLGSELSEDWTMAFKVISNTDGNTNSLNAIVGLFLSNNTGESYTADAHDFVSVWFNTDSSSRRNIRHSYGLNSVSNSGSGNTYLVDNTGTYGGDTLPDGTDITLYCVVNKNFQTTTAKLYTDSALQNQYGATATNTSVSVSNLQYLKLLSRAAGGTDNQAIVKIQSVQIKDGDADWTPKWIEG